MEFVLAVIIGNNSLKVEQSLVSLREKLDSSERFTNSDKEHKSKSIKIMRRNFCRIEVITSPSWDLAGYFSITLLSYKYSTNSSMR